MKNVAAIDIGGTSIKAALVDEKFAILATASAPTPKDDFDGSATVDAILSIVAELEKSGRRHSRLWAGCLAGQRWPISIVSQPNLLLIGEFGPSGSERKARNRRGLSLNSDQV